MPLIKLKHISSFSSEDTAQPSSNLLKPETYRKWRCAEPGEKQAVVVIELEKATKIHSIDVGNNGSALIEVLVGRSSDASDAFKVLLVTSSFMSPADSKSFTNINRVRMFGPDKLSKPVADEKWDKVKIVCTQPFNKNEKYGLSFISLHSPPEDSPVKGYDKLVTPKRLGSFTLRDEEEDDIKPGSLFLQKKKNSPPISSMAAQVRDATVSSSSSSSSSKLSEVGGMFKSRQPVASKPRNERERNPDKQESKPVKNELKTVKQDKPVSSKPESLGAETSSKRKHADVKEKPIKTVSPPPKKAKKSSHSTEDVPFHQMMKGVVFVLSGFKNPERGEIRDKALEMGAQYKPDWMAGCTHLICAFSNTPKYYQVKGKGKIVTKKWISDSHRKKRKLPTRNYHLPGDTSSSEESSSDDEPPSRRPLASRYSTDASEDIKKKDSIDMEETLVDEDTDNKNISEISKIQKDNDSDNTDDEITQEEEKIEKEPESDQDTEDELERMQQEKKDDEDVYNLTTEDESSEDDNNKDNQDESSGPDEFPELPDFFSKKHFLLYGEMDQSTRRTLIRYITAYDGILEEYMTESVDFVITNETWDQNFEDALTENASLAFIKPKWIVACHEKSTLVPFQPYIISPS